MGPSGNGRGSSRPTLERVAVAGAVVAAAFVLAYLASLVRDALSPTESYAAHIGLDLDQCAAVQSGLSDAQARAFCRRPVSKAP